jgi:hypothetical protein
MRVQITLVSNDPELVVLFRESLPEMPGTAFTLEVTECGPIRSRDSLCVWDFVVGETNFEAAVVQSHWRKHLFLTHPEDVDNLLSLVGVSDRNILLKPVTRSTLRAFLNGYELSRVTLPDTEEASRGTLRYERDDVLQMLMYAHVR